MLTTLGPVDGRTTFNAGLSYDIGQRSTSRAGSATAGSATRRTCSTPSTATARSSAAGCGSATRSDGGRACLGAPRPIARARRRTGRCRMHHEIGVRLARRGATSAWRCSACRASARRASRRCCATRRTGFTTRSISASAPATWASTSSTTSSARRCATRSCASCCARIRSTSRPTSASTTSRRCRPISASPAIRRRAASRSTSTCAASASTAPRRSRRRGTALVFIEKARDIYGYDHFVCDTSGSLCEVVDPDEPGRSGAAAIWRRHAAGLDPRLGRTCPGTRPAVRPRAQADVLSGEPFCVELWSEYCAERGIAAGRRRSGRLHPPRLPPADRAPAAALPGDRAHAGA